MSNKNLKYEETIPIPQYEDTEPIDQQENVSLDDKINISNKSYKQLAKDLLKSAAQGFTYGTSDEILGALKALADTSGGKFKDLYEKYRDLERLELERIQEEHPVLSTVAEIAGSIPSAGVVTAPLKAIKAVKLASSAPLLTRLKEAAILGGTGAALEDIGRQKEGISPESAISTGLHGAGISTIGDVFLGKSGQKILEGLKKTYTGKAFERAFKEGKESVGKKAIDAAVSEVEKGGGKLYGLIKELGDKASKIYQEIYSPNLQYDANKFRNLIQKTLDEYRDELGDLAQFRRLEAELISSKKGVINPKKDQIYGPSIQKIDEILEKYAFEGNYDPTIKDVAKKILENVKDLKKEQLKSIAPHLLDKMEEADKLWTLYSQIGEIPGLTMLKEASPEKKAQVLDSIIQKMRYAVEGDTGTTTKRKKEIERILQYISEGLPEKDKKLNESIKKAMKDYQFVRELSKEPEATSGARLGTILYRSAPYFSEKTGFALKNLLEKVSPLTKTVSPVKETIAKIPYESKVTQLGRSSAAISRQTSNLNEEELREQIIKLKENPNTKRLGEALEKALNEGDLVQKNAILNKILQIPEGRKVLQEEE